MNYMKKILLLIAIVAGLGMTAAPKAEAHTSFGISIGGGYPVYAPYYAGYPGCYYGPPQPYYYGYYPYYHGYGRRYYGHLYHYGHSRGYARHGRRR
jgi:hypothetical protein